MGRKKKPGGGFRRVLTFDEEKRREYLTGFHKRKVERRKAAVEELKKKIKEEQKKMREERHKEYMRMLKEREEALEEADDLERLVTSKTESVQYDHPNHTVTVTTISNLDLSGVGLLDLGEGEGQGEKEDEKSTAKATAFLPKKAGDPLLSKKICALTASLHAHSKKKSKGKKPSCFQDKTKKPLKAKVGKTSKAQRRKLTGKSMRNRE
ncbi:nucleolar protein 12 [Rhinatrema bivittatum]|uniref:nucleolar protein 12 n=1 Tax=Rhinatrema bivittatum TaxID=194408 RepID=UPI00112ECDC7|nr:nucleolar protein 12 [Rhinatrema bivittatum]